MSEQELPPYTIPDFFKDFLTDPMQRLTLYLLIFGVVAILQAGLLKRKLLIESPRNRFNWLFFAIVGVVVWRMEFYLGKQALMIFTVGFYVALEYLTHKIIPADYYIIHVYDVERLNIIRDEYIMYKHGAMLCVALQDLWSTVKRIIFSRHVFVRVNSGTNFTENYDTSLWLCNSYVIKEETPTEEDPKTGIRARLLGWMRHRQIVMELDVCQAHEFNRYEFCRNVKVLDFVVEKYEKAMVGYTRLRTMLTAMIASKQRDVLMSALQVFEDAITISEEDRQLLRETKQKIEEEMSRKAEESVETQT